MWLIASLLANLIIAHLEYTYRTISFGGGGLMLLTRLAFEIALMQACLWLTWHHATSLMAAWVVFTAGNMLLRTVNTVLILKEPMSNYTIAGLMAAATAVCLIKIGGSH